MQDFNRETSFSRCDSEQNLKEHGCAPNAVVNPQSHLRTVASDPFVDGGDEDDNVQLRPQQVEIRIRPREFLVTVGVLKSVFGV